MRPETKTKIIKMCQELIDQTRDKIDWPEICRNKRKHYNCKHFVIYKLMQIIKDGRVADTHWEKISGFNRKEVQEDCALFIRSWHKICKRMKWPCYPHNHPTFDLVADPTQTKQEKVEAIKF